MDFTAERFNDIGISVISVNNIGQYCHATDVMYR